MKRTSRDGPGTKRETRNAGNEGTDKPRCRACMRYAPPAVVTFLRFSSVCTLKCDHNRHNSILQRSEKDAYHELAHVVTYTALPSQRRCVIFLHNT
jgi:hypothetical protein